MTLAIADDSGASIAVPTVRPSLVVMSGQVAEAVSFPTAAPPTYHRRTIHLTFPGHVPAKKEAVFSRFIRDLDELWGLPDGWDGAGSCAVTDAAIEAAASVVFEVMPDSGLPTPQVVPLRSGGLQVEWHVYRNDLEIEVRPTGELYVYGETSDGKEIINDSLSPIQSLGVTQRQTIRKYLTSLAQLLEPSE